MRNNARSHGNSMYKGRKTENTAHSVSKIKFRVSGGSDCNGPGRGDRRVEKAERLDSAETGNPLKTLRDTNSKEESPKSFKLQSLGEVRDDSSTRAMSSRFTRPSKMPLLRILTIDPQVGIVNAFVGKTRRQGRQRRL